MFISGQTINYEKYRQALRSTPAPILAKDLPNVKIDIAGLMAYAHKKGLRAGDLSDEEKNMFIIGGTVQSLQKSVVTSVRYDNLADWNAARETEENKGKVLVEASN